MKGSISDKEKELLENSVPDMSNFTLDLISKTKGSISDKEMEFFKKLLPNK
jgi:hypothetical protein